MILLDTSVAVPLVLSSHVAHRLVEQVVGGRPVALPAQAAIETYAVLTRLPGDARVAPADALTLMSDRFSSVVQPGREPMEMLGFLVSRGVSGGATYDGVVAGAALVSGEDILLSRDRRAAATYARLGVNVELIGG
jgi:predicted nucleic acid-binding protein